MATNGAIAYVATSTTSRWLPAKNPLTEEQYVAFAADSANFVPLPSKPWEKHLRLCAHDALKAQLNSQRHIHLIGSSRSRAPSPILPPTITADRKNNRGC